MTEMHSLGNMGHGMEMEGYIYAVFFCDVIVKKSWHRYRFQRSFSIARYNMKVLKF